MLRVNLFQVYYADIFFLQFQLHSEGLSLFSFEWFRPWAIFAQCVASNKKSSVSTFELGNHKWLILASSLRLTCVGSLNLWKSFVTLSAQLYLMWKFNSVKLNAWWAALFCWPIIALLCSRIEKIYMYYCIKTINYWI